jgi:hypothetical protein
MLMCSCFLASAFPGSTIPSSLGGDANVAAGSSLSTATATASSVAASRCGPDHDHCVNAKTWFLTHAVSPGSSAPAVPIYESQGTWLQHEDNQLARDQDAAHMFRTKAASPQECKIGNILIVWRPNDGEPRWPESEQAAQTKNRWQVMVVETINPATGTFTIQGRADNPIPLDAARSIVEDKKVMWRDEAWHVVK